MGPVACVPLLLFAGFFIKNEMIPVYLKWCSYGSFVRYAFEGSLISVYGESLTGNKRGLIPCVAEEDAEPTEDLFDLTNECVLENPTLIMDQFDAKGENFGWDCAMLIFFFLALRILSFIALKVKVSDYQNLFHSISSSSEIDFILF